jgi:Protein of unknown function (DUF3105)
MSKRKLEATRANQARKAQSGRRTPPGKQSRSRGGGMRIVALVVGVLVVAAGIAAFALTRGGDDAEAAFEDLKSAGTCSEKTFPDKGQGDHTSDPAEDLDYPSDPPTEGKHYAVPALWGIYDQPVKDEIQVHNLEHGGIIVQYGKDVPAEAVSEIRDAVLADRDYMLVAPRPKLGGEVVITAWTHLVRCKGWEPDALEAAKDRWRAKGPELVDPAASRLPNY